MGTLASLLVNRAITLLPFSSEILDDTSRTADTHMAPSPQLTLITASILAVVDLVSAPALQAARMDPIEALRFE